MRVIAKEHHEDRVDHQTPPPLKKIHNRLSSTSTNITKANKKKKPVQALSDIDLMSLFTNTATLLDSGVPLIKALETLTKDESFEKSEMILIEIINDIRSGSTFSTALASHPKSFSPLIISLIRAGETSSALVPSLERIVESLEKRRETIAQIRNALTYPAIVVVLGTGAVGFLMAFVVPIFDETYKKAGMPLPFITQALIWMSNIVAHTWWIGLITLVVGLLLYRHYRHYTYVKAVQDRMLLRLPLVGPIVKSVMLGRFVQSFGNLLSAGISIKESLVLTKQVVQHSEYVAMIHKMQTAVTCGEGIGRTISDHRNLVPPLMTQMINLGEQSGDLGKMILQIGRYLDKDLKQRMQMMSTMLEPILTVMMAVVIGTIALAIYLPIFDMFKQVGN